MWTWLTLLSITYMAVSAYLTRIWSRVPAQHSGSPVHVALVTAHPDDEAMFFSPTILALKQQYGPRLKLHLFCLSAGYLSPAQLARGYDRVRELRVSVRALVDDWHDIHVGHQVDDHSAVWQPLKVAYEVAQLLREVPVHVLLTFDQQGASLHRHHVSVHRACQLLRAALQPGHSYDAEAEQLRALLETSGANVPLQSRDVRYFQLRTVSLPYKVSSILKPPFTELIALQYLAWLAVPWLRVIYQGSGFDSSARAPQLLLSPAPGVTWQAMRLHHSQFVWFRVLYLSAASYVYCNVVEPL